jgi:hypothetical protein
MMSAPAVLIHRPSPSGFGGTGDNSKETSDVDTGGLNLTGGRICGAPLVKPLIVRKV